MALSFDEKSFFICILGFNSHGDYKHSNKNISQRNVHLSTTDKTHLK